MIVPGYFVYRVILFSLAILACLNCSTLNAQPLSNVRSKYISITTDTIAIDAEYYSCIVKSKTLDGKYVDDSLFIVDNVTAKLVWNKTYLPLIKV
ncbi:MAG: hypothetical protein IPP29_03940 [Bacteroidetes bacterium]|nr:hypothetical protein [Bacteroidota bacterium]